VAQSANQANTDNININKSSGFVRPPPKKKVNSAPRGQQSQRDRVSDTPPAIEPSDVDDNTEAPQSAAIGSLPGRARRAGAGTNKRYV